MGDEIEEGRFSDWQRGEFRARLRSETADLKDWFETDAFDYDEVPTVGLELEGWLVDENHLPAPLNSQFFSKTQDPHIVAELSKFNFEINAEPRILTGDVFSQTRADLEATWDKCSTVAGSLHIKPLAIGILPTVRDEMLQPAFMSDGARYEALNREIMLRRGDAPLHISISGNDSLDYQCNHLMLEAACTSLQVHLKINQSDAARRYNAAILATAPLVAASANSPFLYGKSLWNETRIPAFEQATATHGFRDREGRTVQRVTLGTDYVKESLLELFVENLSYPDLLPSLMDGRKTLPHLRLQNGTLWRWVRPILGFDGGGNPHLRLEHRVMPAGPTHEDIVANIALCHGIVLGLSSAETPPEMQTSFEDARANFYACAQKGLSADLRWAGKTVNVQSLLLETLLPIARKALADSDVSDADLDHYFDTVLEPRIRSGQTGAAWQRYFIDHHGPNFQALTERYADLQAAGTPVHTWAF